MLALLWLAAKVILLFAGLLLPGAAWIRALKLPRTLAGSFALSAVALYATVLTLQLASVRISLGSLVAGLGAVTAIALLVARLGRAGTGAPTSSHPPSPSIEPETEATLARWWFLPYALFWLAVVWRGIHEPLAGPDIEFRWSFLAEQMLRLGSLDFYPPVSARDFLSYFWAESIPPGVSSLHAWAYACAGTADARWTIPAVLLQVVAVHEFLGRTATAIGGTRAGRCALLAAAGCPLLTWSMLLSQETGLTALSAVGIAFALVRGRADRGAAWAALAGCFAVLGASAREYGLIFPALAAAGLLGIGASRRAWIAFLAPTVLALIWPVRVWLLTGNPFYSLALAGLPINPRFIAWIEHDAAALGAPLHSLAGWSDIVRYLVLFAPAALLGWGALVVGSLRRQPAGGRSSDLPTGASKLADLPQPRMRKASLALLIGVLVILALWLMSVRYTNGGLFYSMRVTSPALALGALALGIAFARRLRHALALVALLALATLPATLALPRNPWRTPGCEWPAFAPRADPPEVDETLAIVLRTRFPGIVLADAPGFQRRFLPAGIPVIPLWSPQADWLFDPTLRPAEAVRRLRESGVRHIVVTRWQTNLDFFNAKSRWSKPPFQVQLIGETEHTAVFAIGVAP